MTIHRALYRNFELKLLNSEYVPFREVSFIGKAYDIMDVENEIYGLIDDVRGRVGTTVNYVILAVYVKEKWVDTIKIDTYLFDFNTPDYDYQEGIRDIVIKLAHKLYVHDLNLGDVSQPHQLGDNVISIMFNDGTGMKDWGVYQLKNWLLTQTPNNINPWLDLVMYSKLKSGELLSTACVQEILTRYLFNELENW